MVDGNARPMSTESAEADAGDSIVDNGDGTVTIQGSTDDSGDAFAVTGTVLRISIAGADSGYRIVLEKKYSDSYVYLIYQNYSMLVEFFIDIRYPQINGLNGCLSIDIIFFVINYLKYRYATNIVFMRFLDM